MADQFELAQYQYDTQLPPEYWAEDEEDDRDHDDRNDDENCHG